MNLINFNNKPFNICHFQGRSYQAYYSIFKEIFKHSLTKPEELDIITFFNNNQNAMLAQQLEKNNIQYINGFDNFDKKWDNRLKIKCAIKALEKCENDIILLCDANDVLINSFDDILEKFKESEKRILFNASTNNFPDILIDKVRDRDFFGKFRYFNAGCCIGYKKDLIEFYENCQKFLETNPYNPWNSEQFIVRNIFANYLENENYSVMYDYNCNIFQSFANTKTEKYGDKYRII